MSIAERIVDNLLEATPSERRARATIRYILHDIARALSEMHPELGQVRAAVSHEATLEFPDSGVILYVVGWGRLAGWGEEEDASSDPAEGWVTMALTLDTQNEDEMVELTNREYDLEGAEDLVGLVELAKKKIIQARVADADRAAIGFMAQQGFGS